MLRAGRQGQRARSTRSGSAIRTPSTSSSARREPDERLQPLSCSRRSAKPRPSPFAQVGCDRTFTDHGVSGAEASRSRLDICLACVRPSDTLPTGRGIELRSLSGAIDTTTAAGKLALHLFAALAEFERDLIHQRTLAGLAAARASGNNSAVGSS